jgi:Lrp/AsnC family transcriptional regulator, leucine-responsive regulatory protein
MAGYRHKYTDAVELDEVSIRILDCLQQNAEMSIAELSDIVGLSQTPCWRRVNELKTSGVIAKSVAIADPEKLGLLVNVFVHVTLTKQTEEALQQFEIAIRDLPAIMECYLMSGEADYMLRVVVHDLREYQHLLTSCLTKIPVVSSIRSSFALSRVKYTTALPLC